MTATEDRELRRAVHGLLQSVPPSPAPLQEIVRRGKGIRLRRAGAAAGALGLAGIVAVAVLAPPGSRRPAVPVTTPAGPVAPGGVFAQGRVDGHAWQLAVQDIADPGYLCQPAIVLNGTDADPVFPAPGNAAAVALGSSLPGTGFGFIQVPAAVTGVVVNGQADVRAVTVAACGLRYHLVGFAYPLARAVRVTLAHPPPGWRTVFTMPQVSVQPPSRSDDAGDRGPVGQRLPGRGRGGVGPPGLGIGLRLGLDHPDPVRDRRRLLCVLRVRFGRYHPDGRLRPGQHADGPGNHHGPAAGCLL